MLSFHRSVASTSDSVMTFLLVCPLTYLEEYLEEDEKSSFLYLAIHGPEVNTTKLIHQVRVKLLDSGRIPTLRFSFSAAKAS